jgi:hypothetical protein
MRKKVAISVTVDKKFADLIHKSQGNRSQYVNYVFDVGFKALDKELKLLKRHTGIVTDNVLFFQASRGEINWIEMIDEILIENTKLAYAITEDDKLEANFFIEGEPQNKIFAPEEFEGFLDFYQRTLWEDGFDDLEG